MKPSQEYYQNRRKLQKELKYDKIKFKPTVSDVEEWVIILNQQFFGNKLPPFDKVYISRQKGYHAFFHYWSRKSRKHKQSKLSVNREFTDKKTFVEVIAHEMVHQFQYLHNEPIGHGPSFMAWSDNFKAKGIRLQRVI